MVFLHRIVEGPADRSYGIHVARLAGLPAAVLERAREVLQELESERTAEHLRAAQQGAEDRAPGEAGYGSRSREPRTQGGSPMAPVAGELPLFGAAEHPLAEALRGIEVETLTPLEALNLIAAWKKRWGREGS